MVKKRGKTVRLGIYLANAGLWRLVRAAAAKRDVSISDYCVRAITNQLEQDGKSVPARETRVSLASAVDNARRFQADTFRGETFRVSSADLIRQTRKHGSA